MTKLYVEEGGYKGYTFTWKDGSKKHSLIGPAVLEPDAHSSSG